MKPIRLTLEILTKHGLDRESINFVVNNNMLGRTVLDAVGTTSLAEWLMWGADATVIVDDHGNTISRIHKDGSGSTYQHQYDDNGRHTEIAFDDGTKTTFKYDDNGRRTEIAFNDGTKTTFKYDDMGNCIREEGEEFSHTSTFDEIGRELTRVYDQGGSYINTYNDRGNLCTQCFNNGNRMVYEYYFECEIDDDSWEEAETDILRKECFFGTDTYKITEYDTIGNKVLEICDNDATKHWTYTWVTKNRFETLDAQHEDDVISLVFQPIK